MFIALHDVIGRDKTTKSLKAKIHNLVIDQDNAHTKNAVMSNFCFMTFEDSFRCDGQEIGNVNIRDAHVTGACSCSGPTCSPFCTWGWLQLQIFLKDAQGLSGFFDRNGRQFGRVSINSYHFFNFNLCLRKHSLNLFVVKYSIQSGLVVLCPINHTKDSSSVMTFKCVLQLLQTVFVRTFLLENVDLEETSKSTNKESNLQVILRALSEARDGYHVRAFKILSKDFGVPQRRVRLFFIGVHKGTYPNFDMDKVAQNLEKFQLKCQKPDTFMY